MSLELRYVALAQEPEKPVARWMNARAVVHEAEAPRTMDLNQRPRCAAWIQGGGTICLNLAVLTPELALQLIKTVRAASAR